MPATITIDDRRSGRPVTLHVGRDGFDALAALNLDDVRLPALLISVAAGDDRLLTRFVEATWNGLNAGTVGLMARAVNCAADRPRARWDLAAHESASAPFGEPIDNAFLTDEFCQAVGHQPPPAEFPRPVRSSIPALLLTGSLDATNPVENQRDVARSLTNTVPIEVEHAAHEALPVPAVQDAVVDFFRGVDVRERRLSAPRPRFVTITEALQDRPRPER